MAGKHLCKHGLAKQLDEANLVCLMKKSTDVSDSKQDNLVTCVPDQKCNYTFTDGANITEASTDTCECGFNPNGQGFCRAGHNISKFFVFWS